MDDVRMSKLRQTIFERLLIGEPRIALYAELRTKLDENMVVDLLDEAIARIRICRKEGSYDSIAAVVRKRRITARYGAWRLLAGFLVLTALLGFLASLMDSAPAFPFGLIVAGVILAVVEWRLRERLDAAETAVDRLLAEAPA